MDFILGDSYRLQLRLDFPTADTGAVRGQYLGDLEVWFPNDPTGSITPAVPILLDRVNNRIVPVPRSAILSAEPIPRR